MAIAFVCSVVALFGVLLAWESAPGTDRAALHPVGLLRWAVSGNWLAKVGGLIVSIGAGALLRYFMLTLTFPPPGKLLAGVALSAGLGIASAVLTAHAGRRAISLALAGAALAVAYLTAYSAYGLFHYVADVQAIGLLFVVACTATVIAVTRRALSIAVLGMVGAYIAPAFALQDTGPLPVYGYYVAASLVTLVMVWQRGWRPLIHLSFLFTLAGAWFFGWTQKFYAPQYYTQMQPMLLALVAIHLAMPLLETDSTTAGKWSRRFDQAYFLLLPIVAAVLGLMLAPQVERDGARALAALGGIWVIAAGAQHLRFAAGGVRYLSIAAIFLVMSCLLRMPDAPTLLITTIAMCLAVVAGRQLRLSEGAEYLLGAVALLMGACYVLQGLFESTHGLPLLNGLFLRNLLLGAALMAAGWSLERRERIALGPIFLVAGASWLVMSLARELMRIDSVYLAEISYLATIAATAIYIALSLPNRTVLTLLGVALLATGSWSATDFPATYLIPLMLAGQILYSLLARQCDEPDGAVARSLLPLLLLPWAIAFDKNMDAICALLVASALFGSLQSQWLVRKTHVSLNFLSLIGFVIVGGLMLYESLLHIERQAWAVAFELIALLYVLQVASLASRRKFPDVWMYEYAAVISVASVSAAMLLRLMGPPGTLTIFDLNQMLLPATVSLLWAAIGALLSWLSVRKRSRTLWSLGAVLLAAAAVKLILFDFGSLGQIGNILATMAVGCVLLLAAWVAPFPPRTDASPSKHHEPQAHKET
jgi:uncharacterized membrane protein